MNPSVRYRRLPGRVRGFVRYPSAWITADHILLVTGSRFSETYQRVYFRDLQALVIRRKPRFVFQWPYVFLLPVLLFLFFGPWPSQASLPVIGAVLLVTAAIVLVSIRFGCYLDLATAVGNVPVRSVIFVWTARRFAAKVMPLVNAAQTPANPAGELP